MQRPTLAIDTFFRSEGSGFAISGLKSLIGYVDGNTYILGVAQVAPSPAEALAA